MTNENLNLPVRYKNSIYDVEISDIQVLENEEDDSMQLVFNTNIENESNLDEVSCYEINELVKEHLYGALIKMINQEELTND